MKDVFTKENKELSPNQMQQISLIKNAAETLYMLIDSQESYLLLNNNGREIALAKTKLEESVMWAVKGITKTKEVRSDEMPKRTAVIGGELGATVGNSLCAVLDISEME